MSRVRTATVAVASGLLATALLGAAPAQAADSPWVRMATPSTVRPLAELNAVAAGSSTRAWAVGSEFAGNSNGIVPGVPLVLSMNGSRWSKVALTGVTWKGSLTAVGATGPQQVWAGGSDSATKPHLLRYDGQRWSETSFPGAGTAGVRINRISAVPGQNPWLSGTTAEGGFYMLRWTGSAWVSVPPPTSTGPAYSPGAVRVAPDGTVWLVGVVSIPQPGFPISIPVLRIHRWTGTGWTAVVEADTSPAVLPTDVLPGPDGTFWVAGAAARLGPGGPPGQPSLAALAQWDGSAWHSPTLPWLTILSDPVVLSGDDAGRAQWTAGAQSLDLENQRATPYLHQADGTWTAVPGAPPVAPEIGDPSIKDIARLPGTDVSISVGTIGYAYGQRVPRIERTSGS
jgi:hypothetical protein